MQGMKGRYGQTQCCKQSQENDYTCTLTKKGMASTLVARICCERQGMNIDKHDTVQSKRNHFQLRFVMINI